MGGTPTFLTHTQNHMQLQISYAPGARVQFINAGELRLGTVSKIAIEINTHTIELEYSIESRDEFGYPEFFLVPANHLMSAILQNRVE